MFHTCFVWSGSIPLTYPRILPPGDAMVQWVGAVSPGCVLKDIWGRNLCQITNADHLLWWPRKKEENQHCHTLSNLMMMVGVTGMKSWTEYWFKMEVARIWLKKNLIWAVYTVVRKSDLGHKYRQKDLDFGWFCLQCERGRITLYDFQSSRAWKTKVSCGLSTKDWSFSLTDVINWHRGMVCHSLYTFFKLAAWAFDIHIRQWLTEIRDEMMHQRLENTDRRRWESWESAWGGAVGAIKREKIITNDRGSCWRGCNT